MGQLSQLVITIPLATEPILNNVAFQPDFLPQSPPEQSSGDSEVRPASGQFECKYCGKRCTAQSSLTKHERTHTRPQRCELCGDAKAERKDLYRHFWAHHKDYAQEENIPNDIIACPHCGEETRSDNLKRHMFRKHEDQSST